MPQLCEPRAVVVGGGFYGCAIAVHLGRTGHRVILLEEAPSLLGRASLANQARVHQGYHYPRDLRTGLSCAANFPRFVEEYRPAIRGGFEKLYAIARRNSRVTAGQFAGFCRSIGAPIREARPESLALFDRDLIEAAFEVREAAFDAPALRDLMIGRMADAGVEVRTGVAALGLREAAVGGPAVEVATSDGETRRADRVYVCLYARMNTFLRRCGLPAVPMKLERAEIALIRPPASLAGRGVTVMDGPFFSTMPYPAAALHSLTHVRYTPHEAWAEPAVARDPYDEPDGRPPASRYPLMIRDAVRYLPALRGAEHVRSLFEVKAILPQNEANDGRPILLRRDHGLVGLTLVLGGKIDNIGDILRAIAADSGHESPAAAGAGVGR